MTVSSTTPPFSLVAAVFVFGDYPQIPWDEAVRRLALKVRHIAKLDEISPTAIWLLGRRTFGKDYKFI